MNVSSAPDPERFEVSKGTLRVDRFMNRFIIVGGLGVIAAVFGIFVFILAEVIPLFQGAKVTKRSTVSTGITHPIALGADEWTELPFVLSADGDLVFIDSETGKSTTQPLELPEDFRITSARYQQETQAIVLGGTNGRYVVADLIYEAVYSEDGARRITGEVEVSPPSKIAEDGFAITSIGADQAADSRTVAAIARRPEGGETRLIVETFERKRSLFGPGPFTSAGSLELTGEREIALAEVLVGARGDSLLVRRADETVGYWRRNGAEWEQTQIFHPFDDGSAIASMNFIQGKVSVGFTSADGKNRIFSLTPTESGLRFVHTKTLPAIPEGATIYASSVRNKAFLLGHPNGLSLRYATTEEIRWETPLEEPLAAALIGGKYNSLLTLDSTGELTFHDLHDPHPEAGVRAFFGKIWYEGQTHPKYIWQSTGGTDDFEPKLSLVPLIFGSLKGTFYALIFAVPVALLAAVYTSQFLKPGLKRVIKPTMEIMASLPSVVLGFLGALWLAPILDQRVPSVMLVLIAIPASAVLIGYLWNLFPLNVRRWIPNGLEFVVFLPVLCAVAWVAWQLGPALERLVFTVTDPATGQVTADFRLWWSQFSGSTFQQRNSLVVGFMMGFAVIPIIFTIAEDALSNVPPSLVSGSLALGASRWQTTRRVVLPTASAGIFSALMIGLGRAVGETMIVVMATGNTPIMDFDIFNGMRTLSANIAVELPEAPHGATLYRTLFLGALVLFILTFFINTLAEVMRDRLRNRYKVIS